MSHWRNLCVCPLIFHRWEPIKMQEYCKNFLFYILLIPSKLYLLITLRTWGNWPISKGSLKILTGPTFFAFAIWYCTSAHCNGTSGKRLLILNGRLSTCSTFVGLLFVSGQPSTITFGWVQMTIDTWINFSIWETEPLLLLERGFCGVAEVNQYPKKLSGLHWKWNWKENE